MYKFEFYEEDDLSQVAIDSLWKQQINMDDWDYLLFFESENFLVECESRFTHELHPKDYNISRLLTGCCCNKWRFIKDFMGRTGVVGVAYHA